MTSRHPPEKEKTANGDDAPLAETKNQNECRTRFSLSTSVHSGLEKVKTDTPHFFTDVEVLMAKARYLKDADPERDADHWALLWTFWRVFLNRRRRYFAGIANQEVHNDV